MLSQLNSNLTSTLMSPTNHLPLSRAVKAGWPMKRGFAYRHYHWWTLLVDVTVTVTVFGSTRNQTPNPKPQTHAFLLITIPIIQRAFPLSFRGGGVSGYCWLARHCDAVYPDFADCAMPTPGCCCFKGAVYPK
jgi:hypothetical protein